MFIDKSLQNENMNKKLTPNCFKIMVSYLFFMITDDEQGLVLYKEDDFLSPFSFVENVELKKHKIKAKTYYEMLQCFKKLEPNEKKLIKSSKTAFFDEFDTTIEVDYLDSLYYMELNNKDVILTKHIICVVKDVDNLERSMQSDTKKCIVVPISKLNTDYNGCKIDTWLKDFLNTYNFKN